MGYYTRYDIDTLYGNPSDYLEAAKSISEELHYILDGGDESMKWYDYNAGLKELSAKFPKEVFILSGDGEENDNMWRTAYHKGEAYAGKTEIVYSEIRIPGHIVKEQRRN